MREPFTGSLDEGILEKIAFDEITPDQAPELKEPNSMNLIKLASRYSDGVTTLRGTLPEEAISYITSLGKPFLCEENIETTCKSYPQFYKEVMGK